MKKIFSRLPIGERSDYKCEIMGLRGSRTLHHRFLLSFFPFFLLLACPVCGAAVIAPPRSLCRRPIAGGICRCSLPGESAVLIRRRADSGPVCGNLQCAPKATEQNRSPKPLDDAQNRGRLMPGKSTPPDSRATPSLDNGHLISPGKTTGGTASPAGY